MLVGGAVDGVGAVRFDKVPRAEAHLEVHFPRVEPEEVWLEACDAVGEEDGNALGGGDRRDGVIAIVGVEARARKHFRNISDRT